MSRAIPRPMSVGNQLGSLLFSVLRVAEGDLDIAPGVTAVGVSLSQTSRLLWDGGMEAMRRRVVAF